jgi:hypothetical protein
MNDFKVTEVIDSNTIRVEPFWQMDYNGHSYSGNRINVRGLEGLKDIPEVSERLRKILINTEQQLSIDSPELIDYSNTNNAIVSCSVYLGQTNVAYYFPEFVSKY